MNDGFEQQLTRAKDWGFANAIFYYGRHPENGNESLEENDYELMMPRDKQLRNLVMTTAKEQKGINIEIATVAVSITDFEKTKKQIEAKPEFITWLSFNK